MTDRRTDGKTKPIALPASAYSVGVIITSVSIYLHNYRMHAHNSFFIAGHEFKICNC